MLMASTIGHSDNYPLVSEEVTYAFPGRGGTQDAQVRGDMIFFTTPAERRLLCLRLHRMVTGLALPWR